MSSLANGFILPPLSAPYGAFEPVLDRLTLETHHRYIYGAAAERLYGETRLRPLLSSETEMPFTAAYSKNEDGRIYDCHRFYFNSILPPSYSGLRMPKGALLAEIQRGYGSAEGFFSAVKSAVKHIDRVGFLWALKGRWGIFLRFLPDHMTPSLSEHPLFCIDLWEHAYFLRYRERRDAYLYGFFRIINWAEIEKRYEKIKR